MMPTARPAAQSAGTNRLSVQFTRMKRLMIRLHLRSVFNFRFSFVQFFRYFSRSCSVLFLVLIAGKLHLRRYQLRAGQKCAFYLRQGGSVLPGVCLIVCLSVCLSVCLLPTSRKTTYHSPRTFCQGYNISLDKEELHRFSNYSHLDTDLGIFRGFFNIMR